MQYVGKFVVAATIGAISTVSASAQDAVTLDILYPQPGFAKFHEPIAKEFMRLHPEITIHFRAPAKDYDEGHLLMQRLAVTNQLPDIYYSGYHLLGELVSNLSKRDQIVDLGPFLGAEPTGWKDANYSESLLGLGQVDGKQYGMAFNASLPIVYVNEDAVRKGGGDPTNLPENWDDMLALAARINKADSHVAGIGYTIHDWPDDWLWQAILRQGGGSLVDPATGKAGFDSAVGLTAIEYLRRMVTEGGLQLIEFDQSRQQFAAGQIALFFDTPARLRQVIELVGDKFKLGTAKFPVDDKANGGLPTGGSAVIVTAAGKAKQEAAWKFIKFATGPDAQKIVVETTGYLPTNKLAQSPEFLGAFYEADARFHTVASQMDMARPWQGYRGGASVRIWRAQRSIISSIMRGDISPKDGLAKLVQETNALIQ